MISIHDAKEFVEANGRRNTPESAPDEKALIIINAVKLDNCQSNSATLKK